MSNELYVTVKPMWRVHLVATHAGVFSSGKMAAICGMHARARTGIGDGNETKALR